MQIRIRFLGLKQAHTAKDVGILICQDLYRLEKWKFKSCCTAHIRQSCFQYSWQWSKWCTIIISYKSASLEIVDLTTVPLHTMGNLLHDIAQSFLSGALKQLLSTKKDK